MTGASVVEARWLVVRTQLVSGGHCFGSSTVAAVVERSDNEEKLGVRSRHSVESKGQFALLRIFERRSGRTSIMPCSRCVHSGIAPVARGRAWGAVAASAVMGWWPQDSSEAALLRFASSWDKMCLYLSLACSALHGAVMPLSFFFIDRVFAAINMPNDDGTIPPAVGPHENRDKETSEVCRIYLSIVVLAPRVQCSRRPLRRCCLMGRVCSWIGQHAVSVVLGRGLASHVLLLSEH